MSAPMHAFNGSAREVRALADYGRSARGRRASHRRLVGAAALSAFAGLTWPLAPASARQGSTPLATSETAQVAPEVPEFSVSRFVLEYDAPGPGLPDIERVLEASKIRLIQSDSGYIAPGALDPSPAAQTMAELNASIGAGPRFSRRALVAVNQAVLRGMSDLGFIGVLVATDPSDLSIEPAQGSTDLAAPENRWSDTRQGGATELRVRIYTARVVQVRTVGSGERVPADQAVNNPTHAKILAGSPLKPAGEATEPGGDLLRRDRIDDYTFRLNRHPGRRVDVAVSAADNPGDVVLDYLVRENKPWFIFGQVSNTGTEQTEEIRERFGFVHNQLTGNDDQLVIDFITGGFGGTYAVSGSYEFPIADRLRLRPFGSFTRYDASQVGLADEGFRGESWAAGGDIRWNFFQHRDLFLDFIGGLRWHSERVNNQTVDIIGTDQFFLPSLGIQLERATDEAITFAYLRGEWNLDDIAGTGDPDLSELGRTLPDPEFAVLQWGLEQSVYLEPLFDAAKFELGESTLAHEISFSFRAQHALDSRLPPSFQDVAGGLETVRGYPESVVAGDDVYIGSFEYRFHLPRVFTPYDEDQTTPPEFFGAPFRLRPQTRYARPDWDLVLKTFIDVARTENEDRLPFETDETLIGTGVGLDLLVGRNFSLRVDWGVALEEVEQPTRVTEGSNRWHFSVTLLY